MTPRKRWPNEVDHYRMDSIHNARTIQCLASQARIHSKAGNRYQVETALSDIERLAVQQELWLVLAKGESNHG